MSHRAAALAELREGPLCVRESTLNAWCEALSDGANVQPVTPQAARVRSGRSPNGKMAGLAIMGPIFHRPNFLTLFFGGSSIVELRRELDDLVSDSSIETIYVEIDSPGGGVVGLEELAAEMRQARKAKPLIGFVNSMACSAAYWLAAQCTEIIVTPSGMVGSCGVFMCHDDVSAMNERIGYKPTYIGVPRFKAEGNPDTPLSDETRQFLLSEVTDVYNAFVADIVRGRGRGLTAEIVRKTFGEGRTVNAQQALKRTMVDRLVPYPSEALAYAGGYANRLRAQEDEDRGRRLRILEIEIEMERQDESA
jgi:signal peptide peptidase SppA